MLALSPKSTIATRGAAGSSPTSRTAVGLTWATKSWSSQRGTARARATATPGSSRPGSVMTPRRQPVDRRWRASARVSTPAIAGMPFVRSSVAELARVVQHRGRRVGDDEAAQPRALGLVVGHETPVVADQRVRHDHDLSGVRRVRGDLLVPGLGRVDHEVPARGDGRAEGDAGEDGAVLEREQRRDRRHRPAGRRSRRRAAAGAVGGRWGDHSGPGGPRRSPQAGMRTGFLLPGLTGPVRRPHGTGPPGWAKGSTRWPAGRPARLRAGLLLGREPGCCSAASRAAARPPHRDSRTRHLERRHEKVECDFVRFGAPGACAGPGILPPHGSTTGPDTVPGQQPGLTPSRVNNRA